jgi:anti-sigma regulatory factor (Ser/Thr protein kinase)
MFEHTLCLRNDLQDLARANDEIASLLTAQNISGEVALQINFGLEEVVTNTLKYGYDDSGEHTIQVKLQVTADQICLIVTDDGRPFNPLIQPPPNVNQPAEMRQPGGLGIYFLPHLFDRLDYRREQESNQLTLCKSRNAPSARATGTA